MIQKKKISLEFLSKIKEINDLLEMHRSILSKDPLIKLSKYKGLLFYFLAHEYGNIYKSSNSEDIRGVAVVVPLSKLFYFFLSLLLSRPINLRINSKKKFVGLLLYIFVDKKYQNQKVGTKLLREMVSKDFNYLIFLTLEKTFLRFYKKFGAKGFPLLGRRFSCLKI